MTAPLDVMVFYVPIDDTDKVLAALFEAGAGSIGDYAECAFVQPGTGQFRPLAGSDPTIGEVGESQRVPENRVELTFPRPLRSNVVAALRQSHPYEEPAFHVVTNVADEPA